MFYDLQKNHSIVAGNPLQGAQPKFQKSLLPSSIFGLVNGVEQKYFDDEINKNRLFNKRGLVATANQGPNLNTSTFFITLTDEKL